MKNLHSVQRQITPSRRRISSSRDDCADPRLIELVRLRVAQIHQCPVSVEKHIEELRARGETNGRLQQVETWKTSGLFDERERAALALCEKISSHPAQALPEYLIREMLNYFTKGTVVSLTLAIMAVNDWNFVEGHQHLV